MGASSHPSLNPLTQLTPGQVNAAESANWRQAIRQALADARCATPAFLTADMDAATQTVTVQVALQERVRTNTGPQWMDIPPIIMVPVCVPRGGGWAITLPLKKGDEGLLIFCDTCFDFWWTSGQSNSPRPTYPLTNGQPPPASGSQRQNELRRHALHDCGFYPGMWSQPNVLYEYSTESAQLRSDDTTTSLDMAADGTITLTAPNGVVADTAGASFTVSNNAVVQGNLNVTSGASGVFSTGTGQSVTVQNGIIIDISS